MTDNSVERKLRAILSADVVGYSRMMGEDEVGTYRTLTDRLESIRSIISKHEGRVFSSPGDAVMAEFASVVGAVQCAVELQDKIEADNADVPEDQKMQFRIGINIGDVIHDGEQVYGDGVNIAARLEGLAEPGGICLSKTVFDHVESKLPYRYEFLGNQTVKNIAKPVGAYRVRMDPEITDPVKPVGKKPAAASRMQVLAGAVAVLALMVTAGVWHFYDHSPKSGPSTKNNTAVPLPEKPSIAVLPFDNMSGDPEQEYFSDGMTEEIITRLSMDPRLAVIARNSTFFYKGKGIKIQQISQELGVKYVVEGSVRKAGNMVRITAQLIDATTERHLWAKTYDREFNDIFNLQDDIAQQVVAALSTKSREVEQARAWRVPTENLTAYDALLRGLTHFLRLTAEENAKAKVYFQRAVELDPEYASAYALLGYTQLMDFVFGSTKDPRAFERISEFARKAISLDDTLPSAHALLADYYRALGQFEQALSQAEKALSLNPNDPSAYLSLANTLNAIGRSAEAVVAIKKAMRLDPHHGVYYYSDLSKAYQNLGRYEEAIASLKEALARNPGWIPAYFNLALSYSMAWAITQNQDPLLLDRALEMTEKLLAVDGSSLYGHFALPLIHLYKKQYDEALDNAMKFSDLTPEGADGYALLATIFASVGRPEEANGMMEKAMQLSPAVPAWYLNTLATVYALSGRQTEAVAAHKRVFDRNPSFADRFNAHLSLTILYVGLGQEENARNEAQKLLALVPHFSVDVWGQRNTNKNWEQIEQGMAALRKAGLN